MFAESFLGIDRLAEVAVLVAKQRRGRVIILVTLGFPCRETSNANHVRGWLKLLGPNSGIFWTLPKTLITLRDCAVEHA